ncbi:MAG: FGGY-family carbohydrate kinase [Anaerolineae bacterium]|jgi:xylulokinase
MSDLLAGVDVGTSGVKVGLFDPAGRLVGLGRALYGVESPQPGWAQTDPELWWHGFLGALREACDAGGVEPEGIATLGFSVLFPAVAPLDGRGRALHPALLYCDQRSLAQAREIERRIPRADYEAITGNRLVPGTCAVTSMCWLRDEASRAYAAAETMGFANTFFTSRLTGTLATDPSHAALSGLADIRDPWHWSDGLCETIGIERERLPQIVGAAQAVGEVTQAAAAETGLRAGTPVVSGCGDVVASAFGAGARLGRAAIYIAGSTDCVAAVMPRPAACSAWVNCAYVKSPGLWPGLLPRKEACASFARAGATAPNPPLGASQLFPVDREAWLGIGTTTSSGVSVEWFAREILPSGDLALMTDLAASSPPGSNRLLYLPYLQGERTPVWDPQARGLFIGLTASTGRGDLARAVFEGVAFALRQVIACAGSEVAELRAVGGGTKNELWNQIKADVLQLPLQVLAFQEMGTLGAALLAGVGGGVYNSLEEATRVADRIADAKIVEPDPTRARLYDELFAIYVKLYPQTQAIMHSLDQ